MAESNTQNTEYPPFCELCLVKFASNQNARLHFDGVQHYNRVMLVSRRDLKSEKFIWCNICCCELNTQAVYETHCQSPKHLKKEQAYVEIQELKQAYKQKLENNTTTGEQSADN